jgi:hypothetical protein
LARPAEDSLPCLLLLQIYVETRTSDNLDLVIKYIDWYIRDIKSSQETDMVAVPFLVKDEDAPGNVATITALLHETRTCEQHLLFLDLISTLDEEKKNQYNKGTFSTIR